MSDNAQLNHLLDLEAIKALKYRYMRFLDTKNWDGFRDCFVPEVTADYGGLAFGNREELVAYMAENMGPGLISMHTVHHPEITIEGDHAKGTWYLHDKVIVPDFHFHLEGTAFYTDEYVRTADGWRVSRTGYSRVYESTFSMESIPTMVAERKWFENEAAVEEKLGEEI